MARDGLFAQAEGLTGCATYHGPSGVRSGVVWCEPHCYSGPHCGGKCMD